MEIYKTYKYKLVPTKEQIALIESTFNVRRFIWNSFLERTTKAYKRRGETLSEFDCYKILTQMKAYLPWLYQFDNCALRSTIKDLIKARQLFFNNYKRGIKTGYSKFKNRKNPVQSFTTTGYIIVADNYIHIPKIGKVHYKKNRKCEGTPKRLTVSRDFKGRYWISIYCKENIDPLPICSNEIGIDVGLKEFATDSKGNIYNNPRFFVKSEKKLIRAQRKLFRKIKGSSSYEKQKIKLTTIHEKIRNQRNTFHHQLSRKLVNENQIIVLENLNIQDMLKNHKLAKHISDAGWYDFINKIKYKSQWAGRTFIQVPTFYPSSQICFNCGYQNPLIKNLSVREWICPQCNSLNLRDLNAAKNILGKGKEFLIF